MGKALAGLGLSALTAGGDFHPALRTSAARNERPERKYDAGPGPQQACSAAKNCMVPCRQASPGSGPRRRAELTIGARSAIQFRFVLIVNNCGRDELWTNEVLACGRTWGPVAQIPQITSVDPRQARAVGSQSDSGDRLSDVKGRAPDQPRAYQRQQKGKRSRRHVPARRHHRFRKPSARGGRGYRCQQQLAVRTLRRRRTHDRLQGPMDRLSDLVHLDGRDRGAASGLRLRHEDSRAARAPKCSGWSPRSTSNCGSAISTCGPTPA